MKKLLRSFIVLSLAFVFNASAIPGLKAQDILLRDSVNDAMFSRDRGPNGKHYITSILRFTAPVARSNEWGVKSFRSIGFEIGGRYKRRLCEFYSTGLDLYFAQYGYSLKQTNKIKPFDFIDEWDKEKIKISAIGGAWYHRFNFNRRGNHLGRYLDLGIYGNIYFHTEQRYKGKHGSIDIKAVDKSRNLLSKTEYGIQIGIGLNKIKLYGQYRLNHNINEIYSEVDLPKLRFGLEFDLTG